MVILAAIAWIAWIACAIVAWSTHTLGTLLVWSIPIPVIMVSLLISMRLLYRDRARTLSRSEGNADRQRKSIGRLSGTNATQKISLPSNPSVSCLPALPRGNRPQPRELAAPMPRTAISHLPARPG
jgi:hypothetical protein